MANSEYQIRLVGCGVCIFLNDGEWRPPAFTKMRKGTGIVNKGMEGDSSILLVGLGDGKDGI